MARVARTELTTRQRVELDRAIRRAEQASRFEFSVFLGSLSDEPREQALRMHALMAAPARSVLVAVDPQRRAVEVVTGADVRAEVADAKVRKVLKPVLKALAEGESFPALAQAVEAIAAQARR